MKFLSFSIIITLTIISTCFFFWMPIRDLIFLTPQDPLPEEDIEHQINESEWDRNVLTSVFAKDDNEALSIIAKPSRDFELSDYEDIKVSLGGKSSYYSASRLNANSIISNDRIPDSIKFPYRPVSLLFLLATIALIFFRKRIFAAKPLLAYTSVGNACRISVVISLLGAYLTLMPFLYGVFNNAMGASTFVGSILLLTGIICMIIYFKAAGKTKALLEGDSVIAEWTLPKSEWKQFIQSTYGEQTKKLVIVLSILTLSMIVIGFIVADDKTRTPVVITMSSIAAAIWVLTLVPSAWGKRSLENGEPFVRIYPFGVMMGKRIYQWQLPNVQFKAAEFNEEPVPVISVASSGMMLTEGAPIPQQYKVVFPVPKDSIQEADAIIEKLNSANGGAER